MADKSILPVKVRSSIRNIISDINRNYKSLGKKLASVSKKIKTKSNFELRKSEIHYLISKTNNETKKEIAEYSHVLAKAGVIKNINEFTKLDIPKVLPDKWYEYLDVVNDILRRKVIYYYNLEQEDGRTLEERIKTLIYGAEETVEALIKQGIEEGWSAWELANKIEQYISPDRRSKLVSPWSIIRADKDMPISYIPENVPAGAVDFNAYRIAITELTNHYRWAVVDSSKDCPFVVGWRWVLSPLHPKKDICDDWASHEEGIGFGVYSDADEIMKFGHPFCKCDIYTITVFHKEFKKYFDKAYKKLDISDKILESAGLLE